VSEAVWENSATADCVAGGFTSTDLKMLHEARCVVEGGWDRTQFAANEFSQYLAIWTTAGAQQTQPSLTVIRFSETGAYALMASSRIVANGKTLAEILPALAVAGQTTASEAA
jgi:hypothetical protein